MTDSTKGILYGILMASAGVLAAAGVVGILIYGGVL
jgi:type III secretory pathway component EscS